MVSKRRTVTDVIVAELSSCVKVDVAILGSQSLISLTVSVDVKQHWTWTQTLRAQELCESRGGRPGLPVPNSPLGLCEYKATSNLTYWIHHLSSHMPPIEVLVINLKKWAQQDETFHCYACRAVTLKTTNKSAKFEIIKALFLPPSYENVKGFLSNCTVMKVDLS